MKITKDFVDLKVEIPALQEDKEGYLVGGFVASPCNGEIGAEGSALSVNVNIYKCACNNIICSDNDTCTTEDTTEDTTEETTSFTISKEGYCVNGLHLSGLF